MKIIGLLLALISGLFFVLGFIIANKTKNKDKLSYLAVSLAFVVMLNLIFFDLIPEIIEIFSDKLYIAIMISLIGFGILKGLDLFIPDHHHVHHDNEKNHDEHNSHVYHIGVITLISLLLHNIIEGIAIYGLTLKGAHAGLLMCVGVALHNIPLGIEIAVSLSKQSHKRWSNIGLIILLAMSSLLGASFVSLFGAVSEIFLGIVTCLTLGMIIYIAFLELLPEIRNNHKHKEVYYGIIIGIVIIILSLLV